MYRSKTTLIPALLALALVIPLRGDFLGAAEDSDGEGSTFLRVKRDDQGQSQALETAIITYVPDDDSAGDLAVDLIGAVHVGDAAYYEQLNEQFKTYDALLYELVAPSGTRVPRGGASRDHHPISALQRGMKNMLHLQFQLEAIDYTPGNFVHADLTPREFAKTMQDRGESFVELFFRVMGQSMAMQSGDPARSNDVQLLLALFAPDRAQRLKRILAEQFEDLDGMMLGLDGPDGSTIITERNRRALSVLRREIAKGRKRIGIFYGAAHMQDMERRLMEGFGLKKSKQRWLTAWDLAPTAKLEGTKRNTPELSAP